jgi:hypothetical protein
VLNKFGEGLFLLESKLKVRMSGRRTLEGRQNQRYHLN